LRTARCGSTAVALAHDDRDPDCAFDANDYAYVHLVRGSLLEELGRTDEARDSLQRALTQVDNEAERMQICGSSPKSGRRMTAQRLFFSLAAELRASDPSLDP